MPLLPMNTSPKPSSMKSTESLFTKLDRTPIQLFAVVFQSRLSAAVHASEAA